MTDEQGDPTARSLTLRAKGEIVQLSGLVNRGLELSSALKHEQSPDRGGRLGRWRYLRGPGALADLTNKDLDRRAAAAECMVDLLGRIQPREKLKRRYAKLILPLADSLHVLFESQEWKAESGWLGREYFPPDGRLRRLLLEGLRVFDPTVAGPFEGASLLFSGAGSKHMLEAMVWLAKHDPGYIDELDRDIRYPFAAAALIELEHRRRFDAEQYLLEDAAGNYGAWMAVKLIAGKLDRPESFLRLVELRRVGLLYLRPLVLEIIRRRGRAALPILQQARELSRECNQEALLWAAYGSIAELEGLDLVYHDELGHSIVAGDEEFPALLSHSPDVAWHSLMERLERVVEDVDVTPLTLSIEDLGRLTPLIPCNTPLPTRRTHIFSTKADNQNSIEFLVVLGERTMVGENRTLASFAIEGILPAPRGVPQIEAMFDIDANGILSVRAKDMGTGRDQKITITASSGLSKDEVEKMQREAQSHAAEDTKRREEIEARNQADSMAYAAERTLREQGDKVPADVKSEVEGKIAAVRSALQGGDVGYIKRATQDLSETMQKVGAAVYQHAGGPTQGGGQEPPPPKGEAV